jgi:hypothetical protein
MPTEEKAKPICPCCATPLESLTVYWLPTTPANVRTKEQSQLEPCNPVAAYACPHCKAVLGGGNASYVGSISFKT